MLEEQIDEACRRFVRGVAEAVCRKMLEELAGPPAVGLRALKLGELQDRFRRATRRDTNSHNKPWMIRTIEAYHAAEIAHAKPPLAGPSGKALRRRLNEALARKPEVFGLSA